MNFLFHLLCPRVLLLQGFVNNNLNIITSNNARKTQKAIKHVIKASFSSKQTNKNPSIIRTHSKDRISTLN